MISVYIGLLAIVFFFFLATTSSGWAVFWFSLLFVGAIAETVALYKKGKGDTFSESVWDKVDSIWKKVLLGVFLVWLTWHLTVGEAWPL